MRAYPLNKLLAVCKTICRGVFLVCLVAPPVFFLGVWAIFLLLWAIESLLPSLSLPEWVNQTFGSVSLLLWSFAVIFGWVVLVCPIVGIVSAVSEDSTKDASSYSYQSTDDYEGDDWRGYASHVQDTMFRH